MKRLSESIWDDIIYRNMGEDIKREDILNLNIDELKCGLFINNIYWADILLSIDGNSEISISEFKNIKKEQLNGWRLPTKQEFQKLIDNSFIYSDEWWDSKAFKTSYKKGSFVELSALEFMQMEENDGLNAVYYNANGHLVFESIDDNHTEVKDKYGDSHIVVVQLVRDNKI